MQPKRTWILARASRNAIRRFVGNVIAAVLGAAWLFVGDATGQSLDSVPTGSSISGNVRFLDTQVPLPPGDWIVVSRSLGDARTGPGNTLGIQIVTVNLAQLENGRVARLIKAITNRGNASAAGWARDRTICDRSDLYHAQSDKNYNSLEVDCWTVTHVVMTLPNNAIEADAQLFQWSDDKGRPGTMVGNRFFVVRGSTFLNVSYYENPELKGFEGTEVPFASNPWHKDFLRGDRRKIDYLDQAKKDGEQLFALVKFGVMRRLPVSTGPATRPSAQQAPAGGPATQAVEQRLQTLKDLVQRGLITEEEAANRRAAILKDM